MALVSVYLAENEMEASIIKGRLEVEGIKSSINPSVMTFYPTAVQGTFMPHGVFVEEDKAKQAREILEESK